MKQFILVALPFMSVAVGQKGGAFLCECGGLLRNMCDVRERSEVAARVLPDFIPSLLNMNLCCVRIPCH